MAPAIIIYCWGLSHLGRVGYLVCFIFCACAALRLARFNVMLGVSDYRYFQGLSSTIAGGVIVTFVLACVQYDLNGRMVLLFAAGLTFAIGLLMVSNLKFYSFKKIHASPKLVALCLFISLTILISLTYRFKGLIAFGVLSGYVGLNVILQPRFKVRN